MSPNGLGIIETTQDDDLNEDASKWWLFVVLKLLVMLRLTRLFWWANKGSVQEVNTESDRPTSFAKKLLHSLPYSQWDRLPDLVLEKIFSFLCVWDRYEASQVCFTWYKAFKLPLVWKTFVLADKTLTRRKYNYHSGWQHILDHVRTSQCLTKVGQHFRCLIFEPMLNFYNLYEFMNMLSYYSEQQGKCNSIAKGVGAKVNTLRYTFACNMASWDKRDRVRLYGTGGKLLEALKRLMNNLTALRWLELRDLMLEPCEGKHLLDELCCTCGETLRTLMLVNATEAPCELLHVGVFVNLQVLVISPQNIGDDVLSLIGQSKLRHLHILQNRFTPSEMLLTAVSRRSWQQCRLGNPGLQVHLRVESHREREVLWQECAPVYSLLYDSPHVKLQTNSIYTAMDLYGKDIRVYGHYGLPRFHRNRTFHERVDSLLLLMVRQCSNLNTLVVRERVSTATVLLLAKTGMNLNNLYIRRNAVILRCDWPRNPEWDPGFYEWLRRSSRSYESVEREVSQILGHPWTMLSDKKFKALTINVQKLY